MNHFLSLATILSLSLLFSCAPDIEPLPVQSDNVSSSSFFASSSLGSSNSTQIRQSSDNAVSSSSSAFTVPSSSSVLSSASTLPSSSSNANTTTDSYELTAFIYDTDASVHPDFSCGRYYLGMDEGNGVNSSANCQYGPPAFTNGGNLKPKCAGVVKGLVKPTLNPNTRKIEYSGNDPKNCWTSADWFNKAFTPTPGVNVVRCYDMHLTLNNAGRFEFDSDTRISTIGGKLIGGFFPEVLASRGTDDYSKCPTCDAKRDADRFPPLIPGISKEMFEAYQSKEGDFNDGDHPPRSVFGITQNLTESIYDWSKRDTASWFLHGTTAIKNTYGSYATYSTPSQANQHFCFESHADFYYDPSQEFYFSGDDDIWVYINNKLVIDLGGNHMAAPGHVKLNTLGLEEGNRYPIDIFFCDKRTANSNIRISTNIFLEQTESCGGR